MSVNSMGRQSSSPSHNNRYSIFSKFRSQLGQRSRPISDYYIEPDDPWRSYFPGDVIKGTVVLTVVRPTRITHLVVCLHGFVKVFKNTVPSGEEAPEVGLLGPGRGRRGAEYLGNGLATLFEDEVVLCGDGRLKEGIYKFRFEMGFPPYPLPSSINFERGTVAYMLTSTLTKPTTMNPTMSCRKRINLLESIDIAPFPAPKARIVTVEPISKRSKSKVKGKSSATDSSLTATASATTADAVSREPSVNGGGSTSDHCTAGSPAPSVSSSSRQSNSSQSFQVGSNPSSSASTGVRNSETRSITPSNSDKTITAKTEVLRAGVLPGDTLPVKLTINHCKQVHSAHGIIITLYRQGRIDLHPSIPVGYTPEGKRPIYEDCYPRSRTGLGGLTMGTSRMSSVFRKDLSQTFAPLIVDPASMTAVVRTSIRIPEDAFPTITRTPGGMINFRYYVEVVADLRGKLTSPERFLPRLNMVSSGSTFSPSGQIINPPDVNGNNSITASWAGNILDTDQIRREKGVIAVAFEVVVGTRDSQRGQGGAKAASNTSATPATEFSPSVGENVTTTGERDGEEEWQTDASPVPSAPENYYPCHSDYGFPEEPYWEDYANEYSQPYEYHIPPFGPVPEPQADGPVDEKARLRRAEETLLPSRPPDEGEAGPSKAEMAAAPTAPVLPEDDHLNDYLHVPSAPVLENGANRVSPAVMSAESVQTIVPGPPPHSMVGPSQPPPPPPAPSAPPGGDKQELERQRLMMEASAPENSESSIDGGPTGEGPSAPVLDEDDELVGAPTYGDESLPRYQR